MLTKIFIILMMFIILGALAKGLFSLVSGKSKSNMTVKALTVRVILSISLFVFLFLAFKYQWIVPHNLGE
ncbi:MAG: hypothetical protein A3E88_02240 [Legionellales bacterium RIFCSPHIGHO2_12_FULL_35_11]|nr:MAG: hypothetical protein A3E88_02240 [Legionellales bacterium RIFCSPHIGHO2_12_FULL_35_11]